MHSNKLKKILIIRSDEIGDFMIFSSLLEHYANLFKGYQIHLLCQSNIADLAKSMPFIDRVESFNSKKLYNGRHLLYNLKFTIRQFIKKYDIAICPVYSRRRRCDYLMMFTRADEKIVFDGDCLNDPVNKRVNRNRYFTKIIDGEKGTKLEFERNIEFINKLGADLNIDDVKPKMWFSDSDEIKYLEIRREFGIQDDNYIVIFPGAGKSIKCWKSQKWANLIVKILDKHLKYKIVISGYGNDALIIGNIIQLVGRKYRNRIINLHNRTTLKLLGKLIQHSRLYIGSDTGAVHIAAAVNTPNVCIMGGGHFGRFYPYGDLKKNKIVYREMDCYECNWKCKYEKPKCIIDIQVKDVLKEAEEFLRK